MAFMWPGLTLTSLILLYGAYCLLDGIVRCSAELEARLSGSRS